MMAITTNNSIKVNALLERMNIQTTAPLNSFKLFPANFWTQGGKPMASLTAEYSG